MKNKKRVHIAIDAVVLYLLMLVVLTAVESRTSAPVRILRDESMQSLTHRGVYPVGEGAGYAGGIVSSAVDGLKAAEAIISQFRP